jgi:hypothetical protein
MRIIDETIRSISASHIGNSGLSIWDSRGGIPSSPFDREWNIVHTTTFSAMQGRLGLGLIIYTFHNICGAKYQSR